MVWTIEEENEWFTYCKCSDCGFVVAVARNSQLPVLCPKCGNFSFLVEDSTDKEDVIDEQ